MPHIDVDAEVAAAIEAKHEELWRRVMYTEAQPLGRLQAVDVYFDDIHELHGWVASSVKRATEQRLHHLHRDFLVDPRNLSDRRAFLDACAVLHEWGDNDTAESLGHTAIKAWANVTHRDRLTLAMALAAKDPNKTEAEP